MAERMMLARKRRVSAQKPIIKLKRSSDEIFLLNLKQYSSLFQLESPTDIVKCLKVLISPKNVDPDLTLISLILGATERVLTTLDNVDTCNDLTSKRLVENNKFIPIHFDSIKSLYVKFHQHLKTIISQVEAKFQSKSDDNINVSVINSRRATIKLVADKIWVLLERSYRKDRLRMQYLYSLLTEHKLDSFGVTSSVVAACQLLGYQDVNMILSEDHSWIEFGDQGKRETMEITWHGKCTEDRRGLSIESDQNRWINSGESPIKCTARMAAATLIMKLNPTIEGDLKSAELLDVKKQLMEFLYVERYFDEFPEALVELAKIELFCSKELPPSLLTNVAESDLPLFDANKCIELLQKAIEVDKKCYNNRLVYPYLELGEYYYKMNHGREALRSWADAAEVISHYKYGKEDEEVYKRFYEIANEFIPDLLKKSLHDEPSLKVRNGVSNLLHCAGHSANIVCSEDLRENLVKSNEKRLRKLEIMGTNCLPLWQDAQAFADFIYFYDGICCWEEDSQTPVLHVTWAQHMCASLLKFHSQVRLLCVKITCVDSNYCDESYKNKSFSGCPYIEDKVMTRSLDQIKSVSVAGMNEKSSVDHSSHLSKLKSNLLPNCEDLEVSSLKMIPIKMDACLKPLKACNTDKSNVERKRGLVDMEVFNKDKCNKRMPNNENCKYPFEEVQDLNLSSFEEFNREINRHFGSISKKSGSSKESETLNPILEVLSRNCSNSIFNPEFFQGRGEPFLKPPAEENQQYAVNKCTSSSCVMEENEVEIKLAENPLLDQNNEDRENQVLNCSESLFSTVTADSFLGEILQTDGEKEVEAPMFVNEEFLGDDYCKRIVIYLKSSKMKSIKDLLTLDRLNTQAIKLQLTAQSNTIFKNKLSSPKQPNSIVYQAEREIATDKSALSPSGDQKNVRRILRARVLK